MQIEGNFKASKPTEKELAEVNVAKEMRDGKTAQMLADDKHYYRVLSASPTGKKLLSLREQINAVERAASDLAAKFKAVSYLPSTVGVFGGIAALEFRSNPGKIWKFLCTEDGRNYYKPNTEYKKGETRREQMNDLPIIDPRLVNRIIGITNSSDTFGFLLYKENYYIVSSHPADCPDAESITMEEFISHRDAFLLELPANKKAARETSSAKKKR